MINQRLKTPKICEQCGESFFPFRSGTGQFCSNGCKFIAKRNPVELTCQHCEIVFVKFDHKSVKYCSPQCYQLAKKHRTAQERLDGMIEKTEYCWHWKGGIKSQGYGWLHFQE